MRALYPGGPSNWSQYLSNFNVKKTHRDTPCPLETYKFHFETWFSNRSRKTQPRGDPFFHILYFFCNTSVPHWNKEQLRIKSFPLRPPLRWLKGKWIGNKTSLFTMSSSCRLVTLTGKSTAPNHQGVSPRDVDFSTLSTWWATSWPGVHKSLLCDGLVAEQRATLVPQSVQRP